MIKPDDIKKHTAEFFTSDPDFVLWCLDPERAQDGYWCGYTERHPQDQVEFERAVMTDGQKELVAMTATVRPERNDEGNWVIRTTLRPTIEFTTVRLGPVEAVRHGWERVALLTRLQWNAVSGMAQGKVSTENLSGPVGIGTMAGNAAQAGLTPMLEFIALISVAIGFMNLIPVPALDGGQLVMLVVEFVRGKPLSEAFQMRLTQLGFVLLMFLAVYVTVNDIGRL